ncbi:MAG TPA: YbaN family protein [Blastocatellia bacterium]|nr:YbaN family protein [Blastocatellia bacterium]
MKIVFNLLGSMFVLLGVLGVFLPLLPATPFLLLASACYVKGSERLHRWLMNNRYLGSYIKNFRERRGMPLSAKVMTIGIFWGSILVSLWRIDSAAVQPVLLIIGVFVTLLILRIKTLREDRPVEPGDS